MYSYIDGILMFRWYETGLGVSSNSGLVRHTARAYRVRPVHVLQEGQTPEYVHRYGQVIH